MNKSGLLRFAVPYIVFMIFFISPEGAQAETLYGCPKDEGISMTAGKCPVCGEAMVPVREGYMHDESRSVIDTLSAREKEELGIKADLKLIIVIYKSPTGEASFTPGIDKNGEPLKREFVQMSYDCSGFISSKKLNDKCRQIGDTAESLAKEREDALRKKEELKQEAEAKSQLENKETSARESMKKEIDDSWPIFYKNQKKAGLKDEQIQSIWEDEKKKVYEKYGYDPGTDSFYDLQTPQTGGD